MLLLTPEQKPFFAGTYFPKTSAYGRIGLKELLLQVHERWETNRERLHSSAEEITDILQKGALKQRRLVAGEPAADAGSGLRLIHQAVAIFKDSFDETYGGFGEAPKFPTPHIMSSWQRRSLRL